MSSENIDHRNSILSLFRVDSDVSLTDRLNTRYVSVSRYTGTILDLNWYRCYCSSKKWWQVWTHHTLGIQCISEVIEWNTINKLVCNPSKTEINQFSSRFIKNTILSNFLIGNARLVLQPSDWVSNLGVNLDRELNLSHINQTCKKAMLATRFIGRLRKYLSKDIYVIHRPGGPYWEKLCPRSSDRGHSFSQYGPTWAGE